MIRVEGKNLVRRVGAMRKLLTKFLPKRPQVIQPAEKEEKNQQAIKPAVLTLEELIEEAWKDYLERRKRVLRAVAIGHTIYSWRLPEVITNKAGKVYVSRLPRGILLYKFQELDSKYGRVRLFAFFDGSPEKYCVRVEFVGFDPVQFILCLQDSGE